MNNFLPQFSGTKSSMLDVHVECDHCDETSTSDGLCKIICWIGNINIS